MDERDDDGRTALHRACFRGDMAEVTRLLERKAEVNVLDAHDSSPLLLAVENGHCEIVLRLCQDDRVDVNMQDSFGRSPLHFAMRSANTEVVERLLHRKADVNATTFASGDTPLHWLLMDLERTEPHAVTASLISVRKPESNRATTGEQGSGAISADDRVVKVAQLLLKHGADAHKENKMGLSALQVVGDSAWKRELEQQIQQVDTRQTAQREDTGASSPLSHVPVPAGPLGSIRKNPAKKLKIKLAPKEKKAQ